jgi:hypothetical protein
MLHSILIKREILKILQILKVDLKPGMANVDKR